MSRYIPAFVVAIAGSALLMLGVVALVVHITNLNASQQGRNATVIKAGKPRRNGLNELQNVTVSYRDWLGHPATTSFEVPLVLGLTPLEYRQGETQPITVRSNGDLNWEPPKYESVWGLAILLQNVGLALVAGLSWGAWWLTNLVIRGRRAVAAAIDGQYA